MCSSFLTSLTRLWLSAPKTKASIYKKLKTDQKHINRDLGISFFSKQEEVVHSLRTIFCGGLINIWLHTHTLVGMILISSWGMIEKYAQFCQTCLLNVDFYQK